MLRRHGPGRADRRQKHRRLGTSTLGICVLEDPPTDLLVSHQLLQLGPFKTCKLATLDGCGGLTKTCPERNEAQVFILLVWFSSTVGFGPILSIERSFARSSESSNIIGCAFCTAQASEILPLNY